MKQRKKTCLIVGGDSTIGRALSHRSQGKDRDVFVTTRRNQLQSSNTIKLDLSDNAQNWHLPFERIDTAFFCAGITSMAVCHRRPEDSYEINVKKTICLMERIIALGGRICFISSNQVFSTKDSPDESRPTNPVGEYGQQKYAVEQYLLGLRGGHSIVRVTKVIHKDSPLFNNWVQQLSSGRLIHAFYNYSFSPVPIDFLIDCFFMIISHCSGGIWHVSGNQNISYYEFALQMADYLGAGRNLVSKANVREAGDVVGQLNPPVLECKRLEAEFGIYAPDPMASVRKVVDWDKG